MFFPFQVTSKVSLVYLLPSQISQVIHTSGRKFISSFIDPPPLHDSQRPPLTLKEKVIAEIKKIYDPEIPVNIYELGLIYDISINDKDVKVKMTLTTPNCPVAESLPKEVKDSINEIKEVIGLKI